MDIKEETRGDIVVLGPVGRIDTNTAPELETSVRPHLESGTAQLVLDMGGVEYTSSAGLRVILAAAKRLKAKGRFTLCALTPAVRQVFELAGFVDILDIRDTVEDALAGGGAT